MLIVLGSEGEIQHGLIHIFKREKMENVSGLHREVVEIL